LRRLSPSAMRLQMVSATSCVNVVVPAMIQGSCRIVLRRNKKARPAICAERAKQLQGEWRVKEIVAASRAASGLSAVVYG